jgi:hypothetical protein
LVSPHISPEMMSLTWCHCLKLWPFKA